MLVPFCLVAQSDMSIYVKISLKLVISDPGVTKTDTIIVT